jgi:hypothetical protein
VCSTAPSMSFCVSARAAGFCCIHTPMARAPIKRPARA